MENKTPASDILAHILQLCCAVCFVTMVISSSIKNLLYILTVTFIQLAVY